MAAPGNPTSPPAPGFQQGNFVAGSPPEDSESDVSMADVPRMAENNLEKYRIIHEYFVAEYQKPFAGTDPSSLVQAKLHALRKETIAVRHRILTEALHDATADLSPAMAKTRLHRDKDTLLGENTFIFDHACTLCTNPPEIEREALRDWCVEELDMCSLYFDQYDVVEYNGQGGPVRVTNQYTCDICEGGFDRVNNDKDDFTNRYEWLRCGHMLCLPCLQATFHYATKYRARYPPRCCEGEDGLVDVGVACDLMGKDDEYKAKFMADEFPGESAWDGISCSACHEQVPAPAAPATTAPATVVTCPRCQAGTCVRCTRTAHPGEACAPDPDREMVERLAREENWRRCPACGQMIEKLVGCNDVHCPCGTTFCYQCGNAGCTSNDH